MQDSLLTAIPGNVLRRSAAAWLVVALLTWILFFVIGITANSTRYLNELYDQFSMFTAVGFVTSWTWTNVLCLACFASLVGEWGRTCVEKRPPRLGGALARAFFIYLALISGQLLFGGGLPIPGAEQLDAVAGNTTQWQYFRVATFVSLLAFMVGYSPGFFASLLTRLRGRLSDDAAPAA